MKTKKERLADLLAAVRAVEVATRITDEMRDDGIEEGRSIGSAAEEALDKMFVALEEYDGKKG
jgi:hypothetical protein